MSVRRLAEEAIQPPAFAFSPENARWAEWKVGLYPPGRQQSAVIPLLWRAQEQEGWISRAAIEAVAAMLGMAYIRVLEVATFYTQFQLQPVGSRAHVQVCGTTPCMLRGAEALRSVCQSRIHHDPHHVNEAGTLSWEEVECLGACVNAPMVMIGNDTYEDLTPVRLEQIIDAFERGEGAAVPVGSQTGRDHAAPDGGRVTLLETATAERVRPTPLVAGPVETAPAPVAAPVPTTPGKKREVSEEAAPAINGPRRAVKVSMARAEAERRQADAHAKGTPAQAMRPGATGAESPAGKRDHGRSAAPSEAPLVPLVDRKDDLKLISGVGPVLEGRLNELGITSWEQVARLTQQQIEAVEGRLRFRGRVLRDNWLGQADALASGGVAEYVKRFGRDPR